MGQRHTRMKKAILAAMAAGLAAFMPLSAAAQDVAAQALRWSPWRAVAARLFWAYYARVMRRHVLPLG